MRFEKFYELDPWGNVSPISFIFKLTLPKKGETLLLKGDFKTVFNIIFTKLNLK